MTGPTQPGQREPAYREAIRERVCNVCLDQKDDGSCGLTRRVCAIERHLPRLAETLSAIQSTRMDEYEAAVRAQVCGSCPEQDPGGRCALRADVECALFAYLPLVLEAIEVVNDAEAGG
jgi:hypothetical protein